MLHRVDPVPPPTAPVSMWTTRELKAVGWRTRDIARAVSSGGLLRLRGGVYGRADTPTDCADAARIGGRLTCVSELARHGIFVWEVASLHVHLPATASRVRALARPVRRHWKRLHREPHPGSLSVELFDALVHAIGCQPLRASIATLDSAVHLGLLREDDLDELFRALPRRYGRLRRLLDPRAEAGTETLMRLILRSVGCHIEVQVRISGVGRVDFLVDGWLIIECDSRAHHSSWEEQRRDRRRDQEAAKLGCATYRPIAEDILWHPDVVRAAVVGLLGARRR